MIGNNEFALEAVREKLKALLTEVEAALGIGGNGIKISDNRIGGGVQTQDSGPHGGPPPPPNPVV